jgi:hypothetical protein
MVVEMRWDAMMWKDLMTCSGYGLTMLHLEYFMANLIWDFTWIVMSIDYVDLFEK